MSSFNVGDVVEWVSQSQGVTIEKIGVVVEVLHPYEAVRLRRYLGNHKIRVTTTSPRRSRNYLVSVERKPGQMPVLYRPRAALLTKVSLIAEQFQLPDVSAGVRADSDLMRRWCGELNE